MSTLRSSRWLEGETEVAVTSRVALRSAGIDVRSKEQRPVIGIANTASDLNPCNLPLGALAEAVRKGVLAAGGLPVVFPAMSLGEDLMKPTAMLYRNLLAMEIEEMIRSNPVDGIVLLANCDKTVPGMIMGAASADIPTLVVTGGARPPAVFKGRRIGTGTDLWRVWDQRRTGQLSDEEWGAFEEALSCGVGACNTMGTASTMAILCEVLGLSLPGSSTIPSGDLRAREMAERAGETVVKMVQTSVRPSLLLTRDAFSNAAKVLSGIGGSTNAVIHLMAIAGRTQAGVTLSDLGRWFKSIPVIVDVEPTGTGLVQDLDIAGGVPAVVKALAPYLELSARSAGGESLGGVAEAAVKLGDTVREPRAPIVASDGLAVLYGSLAPDGAVMRLSTSSPALFEHTGPAVVFDDYQDMLDTIDDPALGITPDSILILRGCGPVGGPAMPEWGMIPIPGYLVRKGVTDMVRVSDARMSGTSFGTVVLHVAPESAIGGALAMVASGDRVRLSVNEGRIDLLVGEEELAQRRAHWRAPAFADRRGWPALYREHVTQAPLGCDFDFLRAPADGAPGFVEPMVGRS